MAVTGPDVDLVTDLLWSHGASAVAERAEGLEAGFSGAEAASGVLGALGGRWPTEAGPDDGAWRQVWRDHVGPVRAGRFRVVPAWSDRPDDRPAPPGGSSPGAPAEPTTVDLVIDPGDSFGSGHHHTTRACLEILSELEPCGPRVLDVGCGTGVLGLAAARRGGKVSALDLAPEAAALARRNAQANRVALRVVAGTVACLRADVASFDLVLANLGGAQAPLALLPWLAIATAEGGRLVLGGMLDGQAEMVLDAYRGSGWGLESTRRAGGWTTLLLVRDRRGPVSPV